MGTHSVEMWEVHNGLDLNEVSSLLMESLRITVLLCIVVAVQPAEQCVVLLLQNNLIKNMST